MYDIQDARDAVAEYFAQLSKKLVCVSNTVYASQNSNKQLICVIFNPEEYQVCYVSDRHMAKRLNRMRRMEKVKRHWKERVKQP